MPVRKIDTPLGGRATTTAKPCFVFAVCGDASHLKGLELALSALRRHSRAEIRVVTDSRRNEIPVKWPDAIDVETPAGFDHHQASIYLKTRLHRLLPTGPRYCYLDSDVFATSAEVDDVFSVAATPVAFAADLSRLHEFSPFAMRCGCLVSNAAERAELDGILACAYRSVSQNRVGRGKGWTADDFERNACRLLVRMRAYLGHLLAHRSASQFGDPGESRWKAYWYESRSRLLHQPPGIIRFVEAGGRWRRDHRRRSWISPAGNDVFHPQCGHLVRSIGETFGITIKRPRWQQWNGGVFLFDERGHAFLEAWHSKTMHIFGLPNWRTRDQGTLAATAWEFEWQDQPLLPTRFNCILDARKGATMASRDGATVTTDAFLSKIHPALAHVLKRDSNPDSDLWQWVRKRAFPTTQEQLS